MTPDQALDILDKVGAQFAGTRQDHINIQLAISTLRSYFYDDQRGSASPSPKSEEQPEEPADAAAEVETHEDAPSDEADAKQAA